MLAKKNRFFGRTTLSPVFRRGTLTRGRLVSVRYLSKPEGFRAAIIVSRKVSKSAVVRNRIRRRIYAVLENNLDKLRPGDLVLTVFDAKLAELSADELQAAMIDTLKRANILS